MTKHVMVPLDGSLFAEQALRYAAEVVKRLGATLHLVRVHAPLPVPALTKPGIGLVFDTNANGHLVRQGKEYLEWQSASLRAHGIAVLTHMMLGDVVPSLEQYVRSRSIDLTIMTTHGRGGLSRAWLGSTADSLVRCVRIPVVLLRPRGAEFESTGIAFGLRHIMIPLDGTELSEQILHDAEHLASLTNARFTLMQVVPPPLVVATGDAVVPAFDPALELERVRTVALGYLNSVAERLRERGVAVETQVVVQAQTAVGILEQALESGADMIAMTTHARGGWARVALGSVADKVLRSTSVPLLLKRQMSWSFGLSNDAEVEMAVGY